MAANPGSSRSGGDREPLSASELARTAANVLGASPFPALVLEMPSERIVAASPSAIRLIGPANGVVVGRLLEEFTADRPALGTDLFAGGRLNGFETFRLLRRAHGTDMRVRMWIRSFNGQPATQFVVVVIVADEPVGSADAAADWEEAPSVVGIADASLLIERISGDAEELFNQPVEAVLGSSLLSLVVEGDVSKFLVGLSEATGGQSGITLYLDIQTGAHASPIRCEVVLLPLQPSPSCAFVFLPVPPGTAPGHIASDLSAILRRLGRGAEIAQLARGVFRGITNDSVPGLNRLSTRELEVVSRLLDGDRAPAIASRLFLSQSTVRNHLASVFAKLGVTSQQELVNKLRQAQSVTP